MSQRGQPLLKHQPYLAGGRVDLRPLRRSDLRGMFHWANDSEVTQYMVMGTVPQTMEALEREYDQLSGQVSAGLLQLPRHPQAIVLAIIERSTKRHIGNVGLYGIAWVMRVAELRCILGAKEYWGRGYAREAYRLAIGYAFDRLNLRKLWAGCRGDHVKSARALERVGFIREGCQRQHVLRNEQAYDILLFGLLRAEFHALPPPAPNRAPGARLQRARAE